MDGHRLVQGPTRDKAAAALICGRKFRPPYIGYTALFTPPYIRPPTVRTYLPRVEPLGAQSLLRPIFVMYTSCLMDVVQFPDDDVARQVPQI